MFILVSICNRLQKYNLFFERAFKNERNIIFFVFIAYFSQIATLFPNQIV